MRLRALFCVLSIVGLGGPAIAAEPGDCPNPNALGVSRVLVVDPTEHARIGTMQYRETLPLADHEVVLTFDDGPLPPYTDRVLETLAAQCVKATYFLIGHMAQVYPETARKIYAAGHTIGTHSQNHPLRFERMPIAKVQAEVDQGIASVSAALGNPADVAPFFRIPGLLRADGVEKYLASHSLMTWSADFPADDWTHIKGAEVMRRALSRLEAKGRGVLLLHDMQPATVVMLPALLRELKRRGYHIVQVVPATGTLAKTPTTPEQWAARGGSHEHWPPVGEDGAPLPEQPALAVPGPRNVGNDPHASGTVGQAGAQPGASAPTAPAGPAMAPADPRADIVHSVDARPMTTTNMPVSGIP
jgi:peptidoglycan/xylan/chitin deacetylase (PgdA/CDA1 family)